MLQFPDHLRVRIMYMYDLLSQDLSEQALQEEMARTREAMEQETLNVAEGFRHYGIIVNRYYSQFPPFGTNIVENDFEDFVELIGHSVVFGNYSLISEWGTKYPLTNPHILAAEPFQYLPVFRNSIGQKWQHYQRQRGWPEVAKNYWQYLIDSWEHQLELN